MKPFYKITTSIILSLLIVGCNSNEKDPHHIPPDPPLLVEIKLSGEYPTTFEYNSTFSYEGLVVTAYYDNDSHEEVTDYQVSSPSMTTSGYQDVTVTYLTESKTYQIYVNEYVAPKLLDRIELSGTYPTTFTVDDEFSYEGLVVTAYYDDDSYKTVTPTNITNPDMSSAVSKTITVTYEEGNRTRSATYDITINPKEGEEEEETYQGYVKLAYSHLTVVKNSSTTTYLNPDIVDNDSIDVGDFPFRFEVDKTGYVEVGKYGSVKSAKQNIGSCVVTCICTENTALTAKCYVEVVESAPQVEKGWVRVDDYDSLSQGDILVIASPRQNVTASLDTLHSVLNPVSSTFSSDKKTITNLGEGSAEFFLGFEEYKGEMTMTLEAQTGEYLVCTNQGKVKLDSAKNMNRYWDIHSNVDPETGDGNIEDGAVIENYLTQFGYLMYNAISSYFTTYVENTLRPDIMELPFLYRYESLS